MKIKEKAHQIGDEFADLRENIKAQLLEFEKRYPGVKTVTEIHVVIDLDEIEKYPDVES